MLRNLKLHWRKRREALCTQKLLHGLDHHLLKDIGLYRDNVPHNDPRKWKN